MTNRGNLTRESIVRAAMKMLDREGEKAFSMRKLAAEMGVDPMALYHHHSSRRMLMHEVLQALMTEFEMPRPTGDWRNDIRNLCDGLRQLAKRHPGAFRVYELYEDWVPAEHRVHEAFHATLAGAGFPPPKAVRGVRVLLAYTEAFAVDEITGWLAPFDADDRADFVDSLSSGDYPTMAAMVDEIGKVDPDADFAFGLDVLIRGLEAELS
ncbi:TetR/AcrR family transcriptional regulator C-terminal domain-containing protein [Roseovarius salis]|uniref:TetR/AcrR family transcriptional regulator n=1 Tax=Roseovarius salis TaxID=3376063 RepID=UPI0037C90128